MTPERGAAVLAQTPIKRLVEADEIAEMVVWLSSEPAMSPALLQCQWRLDGDLTPGTASWYKQRGSRSGMEGEMANRSAAASRLVDRRTCCRSQRRSAPRDRR